MPSSSHLFRALLRPMHRFFADRLPAPPATEMSTVDIYGGAMTCEFNWLHRWIFPRFFRKIRIDGVPPADLKAAAEKGTLVYVSPSIGQLEYNFFNFLVLQHDLPLARFVNELHTTWWRPGRQIAQIWQLRCDHWGHDDGPIPHPVRSGYLGNLLAERHCVLLRLKTSLTYDDLFWDDPAEDPLIPLIRAQRTSERPIFLVPMQFLWDRRPERVQKGLVDLLFGERDNPGRLRKFIRFWRNYKNRAAAQIGEPIALADFIGTHAALNDQECARILRQSLLGIIQREKQGTTGPALKPRRWILDQVVDAERVQRIIYASARDSGKPVEDFKQLAHSYADEIAADIHFSYIEFAGWILRWVFRNVYNGFTVDDSGLNEVKRAMTEGSTVLVPNHRSHMDYLLLSYVLYQRNMAMPHCAAGINMSFWPLGPFFRRCGAFFLRRTFGKHPLYRAVFEEYLTLLIREKYCVEFYIEGGRSRTGKSLAPRMGILSMLTQAMREGAVPDLKFIPVAITYDQVIEQKAYLTELAGGTKTRERAWHLLRLGRYLRRRYGHIYLNLGEPISFVDAVRAVAPSELCSREGEAARSARGTWGTRGADPAPAALPTEGATRAPIVVAPSELCSREGEAPAALPTEGATRAPVIDKPRIVQHLAQTIMYAINKETVVTPAALVATALLLPLKRAVTETEVLETIDQMCKYLEWKKATFSQPLRENRAQAIHEVLERLAAGPTRPISRHEDFQPVCYEIDEGRRAQLDYSKNTCIHFFVSLACLAVILRTHFLRGEYEVPMAAIEADYERCKQLFHFEFSFSSRFRAIEHIERILGYLSNAGLVEALDGSAPRIRITPPGATRLRLFSGLLRNFFESYKAALLTGPHIPISGLEERALIKLMIRHGQHLLLLGEIRCPEAISQANFQNAINAYKAMGLLIPTTETLKGRPLLIWRGDHPEAQRLQQALEEWC